MNPSPLPAPPASAPASRPSRLAARAARCVVGATLALTQVACPGIPLRPVDESCPAGALQTIRDLGYEPGRTMDIWLDAKLPDDATRALVREGPITSEVIGPAKYGGAKLTGRIIFGGDGRMYVRYTAITLQGGRPRPFCAQLAHNLVDEFGMKMHEGSTPQAIKSDSRVVGFMVDHFFN